MADNTQIASGSGDTLATDDVATLNGAGSSGVKVARTKVGFGSDGDYRDVDNTFPLPVEPRPVNADFWPGYTAPEATGRSAQTIDPDGATITRGAVLTDEGTFRVNFANSSLAVALGSVTISGATVTGTFTGDDVHRGDYFKLDADAESAWTQIASIDSDTQITLISSYSGGSSGNASRALVKPTTGSGGTISVASGQCTIATGTTNPSTSRIERLIDYAPLVFRTRLSISQRIANQTILAGLVDTAATRKWFARFSFTGTTNTTIVCETGRNPTGAPSASETEQTTVTILPATSGLQEYRIELLTETVRFYINDVLVATHTRVIPAQHDEMVAIVEASNSGTVTTTNVVVDYVTCKNHNKVEVGLLSNVETVATSAAPMVPINYSVAGVIAINTDLLVIDCSQFRSVSIQCTSMGTTGVVTPAWSNDGTTFVAGSIMTGLGAAAATFNAAGLWTTHVFGRYLRLRLTTATTAGTTTLVVMGLNVPVNAAVNQPVTLGANQSVNSAQIAGTAPTQFSPGGASSGIMPVYIGAASTAPDRSSAAAVATGNTGTITSASGVGVGSAIVFSSVGGTTPTLDLVLQESLDNGTTWRDLWHAERVTANGTITVPPILVSGRRRWSWTIGGTSPTFTFAINAAITSHSVVPMRRIFDRTAGVLNGTLSTATAALAIDGCSTVELKFTAGAITTTPGAYQIQLSDDGTNWVNVGSPVTAVASSTVRATVTDVAAAFARAIVTTGATGQTGTVLALTARG